MVAFCSLRSDAHCKSSNLEHQFILILSISRGNIKSEIKILHRKAEIGKISKYFSKKHFTFEPFGLHKQKQYRCN